MVHEVLKEEELHVARKSPNRLKKSGYRARQSPSGFGS
jgi:hypothetical protein